MSTSSSALRRYNLLWMMIRPAIGLILSRRASRGKEIRSRLGERYGRYGSASDLSGSRIWIHAVSVGESVAAIMLAKSIRKRDQNSPILITTNTVTAAARVAALDPALGIHHLFQPLDHPQMVASFLRRISPKLAIFLESDFWPNLVIKTAEAGIPVAFASSQLSDRAFARWQKRKSLAKQLFGSARLALAVDQNQADRLVQLGVKSHNVQVTGSLKLPDTAGQPNPDLVTRLSKAAGNRHILLAASTHKGEEETVIAAAARLGSDWMTIIAPRHPERGADVATLCRDAGMTAPRRALGEHADSDTAIYIADTLGEMDSLFEASDIVFLGGSLLPYGGHNPIEPAAYGRPILTGPHVFKNSAEFEALRTAGAVHDVHDAGSLAKAASAIIKDSKTMKRNAVAAKDYALAAGKRPEIAADLCLTLIKGRR